MFSQSASRLAQILIRMFNFGFWGENRDGLHSDAVSARTHSVLVRCVLPETYFHISVLLLTSCVLYVLFSDLPPMFRCVLCKVRKASLIMTEVHFMQLARHVNAGWIMMTD